MPLTYSRERFDEYIARFNAEDATAFEDFLHPEVRVLNATLEIDGIQGMKDHYQKLIWPDFVEHLNVLHFVSDQNGLAVRMWTNFRARHASEQCLFGPSVKEGDCFDYRGVIIYTVRDGLFDSICVAYNSFTHTPKGGTPVEMGIPGGH